MAPDDVGINFLLLYAGGKDHNWKAVKQAKEVLNRFAPNVSGWHLYAGMSSAGLWNLKEARQELQLAKTLGVSADIVDKVLTSCVDTRAYQLDLWLWRSLGLVTLLLATVGQMRARKRLWRIKHAEKTARYKTPSYKLPQVQLRKRRFYRFIAWSGIVGTFPIIFALVYSVMIAVEQAPYKLCRW